jgi:hypothetical protein
VRDMTREFRVSISVALPETMLPASSRVPSFHTASQLPRSDQVKDEGNDSGVRRLLHDGVVDRDVRAPDEGCGIETDEIEVRGRVRDGLASRFGHLRRVSLHFLHQLAGREHEDAGVPVEAAIRQHALRFLERRLFDEASDGMGAASEGFAGFDIAIAGGGFARSDAEGHEPAGNRCVPCRPDGVEIALIRK